MKLSYLISKLIKKMHIPAIKNSSVDKTAKVCSYSHVVNSKIGKYSYVGNNCTIVNAQFGNFCSIADNCIIGGANHPINWVSTSPVFHQGKNIMEKNFSEHFFNPNDKTVIGNDVWIGNNCLIKNGVVIGNGAVIGMGSVLTKNVGDYEIWAGNPAKLIRKRFDENTIKKLAEIKWWDLDEGALEQKAKFFNDIELFFEEMEKH